MLHRYLVVFAALGSMFIGQSVAAGPVLLDGPRYEELTPAQFLADPDDWLMPQVAMQLPAHRLVADAATNPFLDGLWVADVAKNPEGYLGLGGPGFVVPNLVWDAITAATGSNAGYLVATVALGGAAGVGAAPTGTGKSNGNGSAAMKAGVVETSSAAAKHGQGKHGPHDDRGAPNGPHDPTDSSKPIPTSEPSTGLLLVLAGLVGLTVRRLQAAK